MLELNTVQQIAVWVIPVVFAITLHEAAHAWVAYRLGDMTAKALGRLSFNPVRHIDPLGSVIIPLIVLVLSNFTFVFGWAKPVPISPSQFKKPRRDIALSTAAGPLSNIIMAFLWTIILKIALLVGDHNSMLTLFIVLSANAGININLLLAFLNLIPIPPLDGSKIVACFLPYQQALHYEKIEPYGFFILIILAMLGVLNWLILPPMRGALAALSMLFNL